MLKKHISPLTDHKPKNIYGCTVSIGNSRFTVYQLDWVGLLEMYDVQDSLYKKHYLVVIEYNKQMNITQYHIGKIFLLL